MRDNSGGGKSENNLRDPTLKEHAGEHRAGRERPDAVRGPQLDTAGGAAARKKERSSE